MTIADTVVSMQDKFSTLLKAAQALELVPMLSTDELTVFAPTDEAFTKALAANNMTADELFADKEKLKSILQYHVVKGRHPASEVVTMDSVETVQGGTVMIKVDGETVWLNPDTDHAQVIMADVECDNGIVHVIDAVLMPM